jgi:hypothetical protein
MMKHTLILLALAGCAPISRPPPPIAVAPMAVDFEIRGEPAQTPAGPTTDHPQPPTTRNQPPDVKLKLGHYINPRFGIGLVIDRTGEKTAKIRFDGTDQTISLFVQYFWHRTEYHRVQNEKVLEVSNTGRIHLHMSGVPEGGILLFRDGDADPL